MIVITGATGTIGRELSSLLLEKKIHFRAISRSKHRCALAQIPESSLCIADILDPKGREAALLGVTKLFLCTPLTDFQLAMQRQILETSLALGVQHIVKIGTIVTDKDNRIGHAKWHQELETKIQESGVNWTFLRPTLFSAMVFEPWARSAIDGALQLPLRNGRIPWIDPRDVATVAMKALVDSSKFQNKAFSMTGPEALSMEQVAIILSNHFKQKISYQDCTHEAFISSGKKHGLPSWLCHDLIEMFEYFAFNRGSHLAILPVKILDKPRTFREYVQTSFTKNWADRSIRSAS